MGGIIMDLIYKVLIILLFAFDLEAMIIDGPQETPPRLLKTIQTVRQRASNSYLTLLPKDIWTILFPLFSMPLVLDNRGDQIMQVNAEARKIAQLALEFCDFKLDSDQHLNDRFIKASEFYIKHDKKKDVQSYFAPCFYLSLACALNTSGAKNALRKEIDKQMEFFKKLSQQDKNKLLIDVIRRFSSGKIIKKIIENGAEVNTIAQGSSWTPLRYAVEQKNRRLVKLLLKLKASPHFADTYSINPLHRAAMLGCPEIVELLAPKTNCINVLDQFGYNALCYAAKNGDSAMVLSLLQRGAKVEICDETDAQKNVFACAVEGKSLSVLHLLLDAKRPGYPNIDFLNTHNLHLNYALRRAVELGNSIMVNQLLLIGAERLYLYAASLCPDHLFEDKKSTLTVAIENQHTDIALDLIDFAKDRYYKRLGNFDDARSLALSWAVFKHCYHRQNQELAKQFKEIITLLLSDDSPDPLGKKLSESALFLAAEHEDEFLFDQLEPLAFLRTEKWKEDVLNEAVEQKSVPAVKLILKRLPDLNKCNEKGENILFKAVRTADKESFEIIDSLLRRNEVNLVKTNISGETVVHAILANPNPDVRSYIIDALHKRGVPLDEPNECGKTALHLACAQNPHMTKTALLLLERGARLDKKDNHGNTPFMYSVAAGNMELVEIFIKMGGDINQRNNSGCGLLTKAALVGEQSLIKCLTHAGARRSDFIDSMLRQASKSINVKLMQELIEEGANVNGESTSRGNTPLHKVILSMLKMQQQRAPYSFNAIILLANSKANFKAKNHKGETPLELAQSGYDAELVRLLLDHSS